MRPVSITFITPPLILASVVTVVISPPKIPWPQSISGLVAARKGIPRSMELLPRSMT